MSSSPNCRATEMFLSFPLRRQLFSRTVLYVYFAWSECVRVSGRGGWLWLTWLLLKDKGILLDQTGTQRLVPLSACLLQQLSAPGCWALSLRLGTDEQTFCPAIRFLWGWDCCRKLLFLPGCWGHLADFAVLPNNSWLLRFCLLASAVS